MPHAKVLLKAPPGCAGASWNGQWFESLDGLVEVPAMAVAELTRSIHGFTVEGPTGAGPLRDHPRGLNGPAGSTRK